MSNQALFTELEAITKEEYLPAFNNEVNTETSPLLSEIKKEAVSGSGTIVAAATVGTNGGAGYGLEGRETPDAGAQRYQDFVSSVKDLYVNIEISQKSIELATGVGSILNAYDQEIKSAKEAAKILVGRSLYGNGKGKLATVKGALTNEAGEGEAPRYFFNVDDPRLLIEGMTIDIFANATGAAPVANSRLRISFVSREKAGGAYKVYVETPAVVPTIAANMIVVQQNTIPSEVMEITGLDAIFAPASEVPTIYGVSKTEKAWINPLSYSVNDITNAVLRNALRRSYDERGVDIDLLVMGYNAYDKYVANLEKANQFNLISNDMTLKGGFKAIRFAYGNRDVAIVPDKFMPADKIYGIKKSDMVLRQTDWKFAEKDGGIFNLMEKRSTYRALLCNYAELMCKYPGGIFQINLTA